MTSQTRKRKLFLLILSVREGGVFYMGESFNQENQSQETNHELNSSKRNEHELKEEIKEWFLLRNNNHLGPYSRKNILEYYHQGVVNEYSLIWKEDLDDWMPLKKVKDIYDVLTPESFDDVSLPELPDLRMIELEAQRELEKEIPPPKMKLVDGINRKRKKEIEAYRHELREQLESDGPTRTASPKIYQTSIGKNGTTSAGKEVELKGTRVSLPPLPFDEEDELLFSEAAVTNILQTSTLKEERTSLLPDSPEIKDVQERNTWLYNFLALGVVALFVTIPVFYFVMANRPVIHQVKNMSREGLQRINFASSEMHNNDRAIVNLALSKDLKIYGGFNRSGQFAVKGTLNPVEGKIAASEYRPVSIVGSSISGLLKLSPSSSKDSVLPEGLYQINLNLIDQSNIGELYSYLKQFEVLHYFDFIKNYQKEVSISTESWLGANSIFLTKRHVDEFQRKVWENVNRPFDYLFQQYDTLSALMVRFNEIFFNATTVKSTDKSKVIFARKYGREVAPVLQMIGTEELVEEEVAKLNLPKNLEAKYREGFMLATSISRSVSAVASEVDLFLSAKRPWNRFIRIEQRNKVNSSLQKLKKRIDVERSKLEKLVEEFSKSSLST